MSAVGQRETLEAVLKLARRVSEWLLLQDSGHSLARRASLEIVSMILFDPIKGASEEFFAVADVQLLFHAEAVRFDGFGTDVEPLGNLLNFQAIADELEDFQLAIGEAFFGTAALLERTAAVNAGEQFFGHGFAEVNFPLQDSPNRVHDLVGRLIFGDVAQGSGLQNAFGVQRLLIHRPDQHPHGLAAGFESLDEIESIAGLQPNVDDGHIGLGLADELQGLGQLGRFAAHQQIGVT